MAYKALNTILLGQGPSAETGETVPEYYLDMDGARNPVDFERLVSLGQVEKIVEPPEPAAEPASVEKLDERKWTHDATDEVFVTKHAAVADAEEAIG